MLRLRVINEWMNEKDESNNHLKALTKAFEAFFAVAKVGAKVMLVGSLFHSQIASVIISLIFTFSYLKTMFKMGVNKNIVAATAIQYWELNTFV